MGKSCIIYLFEGLLEHLAQNIFLEGEGMRVGVFCFLLVKGHAWKSILLLGTPVYPEF